MNFNSNIIEIILTPPKLFERCNVGWAGPTRPKLFGLKWARGWPDPIRLQIRAWPCQVGIAKPPTWHGSEGTGRAKPSCAMGWPLKIFIF